MLLLLIYFAFIFPYISSFQVPICKAAHYVGFLFPGDSPPNATSIYQYSFDVYAEKNDNDKTYSNILTIRNFNESSKNTSIYRSSNVFTYNYNNAGKFKRDCSLTNGLCTVTFPNGFTRPSFSIFYINTTFSETPMDIYVNNGIISNGVYGNVFNDTEKCSWSGSSAADRWMTQYVCCKEFEYAIIPDNLNESCEELEATTFINDPKLDIGFKTNYVFDSTQLNASALIINSPNIAYKYSINIVFWYLEGNKTHLSAHENMTVPDNFHLKAALTFWPPDGYTEYRELVIAELIRYNNVLLKIDYTPYTPNSPCSSQLSPIPFTESSYESSVCCSKFKKLFYETTKLTSIMSTPTTILLSSVTPLPKSSTASPVDHNFVGTPCSDDTSKAWLDIIFVIDVSNAMTSRSLKILSGEIATFMEFFNLGQFGNHTSRAGIVIFGKNITTIYQLTDVTNNSNFVDVLFSLSSYANPNENGGNIEKGLQEAYRLLQTQKSFRIPVIVLFAATYNPNGLNDAHITANSIKDDGITIIVVNFATSDGVLTNALQNISSTGYYYISTKINCICPHGSLQFRIYNSEWLNYTNYADCFYSDNTEFSPTIASKICEPGILISLTSPQKLDFVTENNDAFHFNEKKKFTIGLHKSNDSNWKWWDYNKSEYLYQNYPAMEGNPGKGDNYGYMWNHKDSEWKLQTGNNEKLPYICQLKACDAEYICNRKLTRFF